MKSSRLSLIGFNLNMSGDYKLANTSVLHNRIDKYKITHLFLIISAN